jgi:chromosome segregation ATPase
MADYNDYLRYLKHVDDTTGQDFKARENVLKKDISNLQTQFKEEKSKIESAHKKEKAQMEIMFKNNVSDLKAQFKTKEEVFKKEISDLQAKNKGENSKIESAHKEDKIKMETMFKNNVSDLKAQFKTKEDALKKAIYLHTQNEKELHEVVNTKSEIIRQNEVNLSDVKKELDDKIKEISNKNNIINDLESKSTAGLWIALILISLITPAFCDLRVQSEP